MTRCKWLDFIKEAIDILMGRHHPFTHDDLFLLIDALKIKHIVKTEGDIVPLNFDKIYKYLFINCIYDIDIDIDEKVLLSLFRNNAQIIMECISKNLYRFPPGSFDYVCLSFYNVPTGEGVRLYRTRIASMELLIPDGWKIEYFVGEESNHKKIRSLLQTTERGGRSN